MHLFNSTRVQLFAGGVDLQVNAVLGKVLKSKDAK